MSNTSLSQQGGYHSSDYHGSHLVASQKVYSSGLTPLSDRQESKTRTLAVLSRGG